MNATFVCKPKYIHCVFNASDWHLKLGNVIQYMEWTTLLHQLQVNVVLLSCNHEIWKKLNSLDEQGERRKIYVMYVSWELMNMS